MRHFSPQTGKEETCKASSIKNCPYTAESHINNFQYAVRKAEEIKLTHGEDSLEYTEAVAYAEMEQKNWDATEDGINELKERIEKENNVAHLRSRLLEAEILNASNAFYNRENKLGRPQIIAQLMPNPYNYFDEEEKETIVDSVLLQRISDSSRNGSIPTLRMREQLYNTFCENIERSIKKQNRGEIPTDKAELLEELKKMPIIDSANYLAYKKLFEGDTVERSRTQLKNEIKKIADLRSVDFHIAESFYNGYREQYKKEFAHLPESEQPNPPSNWVKGKFKFAGYRNDFSSRLAPSDKASMYAIYRLRSDSKSIPEEYVNIKPVASIDLETAGPSGKTGLLPENGTIIEVGINTYNPHTGEVTHTYEQLIKPDWLALKKYGTGAVEVHQITVEDVQDKPDWDSVKDDVSKNLKNTTLLAQNSFFEKTWLAYHGDKKLINEIPIVDTLDIGRKHMDLSNHKLETLCRKSGVPYTNGHRALHDAKATAELYFKIRKNIEKTWRNKPARAKAPALTNMPENKRYL